uniref:DNA replication factor RFC1 C-terminal domain-containing protein n=1 Tax=viral metagenome TaxID=1070528 RepID=A0A6C0LT15_9ZZZZ
MTHQNWLDKYKPQKSSDFLGDKYNINQIDKFIKQFYVKNKKQLTIKNPNIIITGTNGIGKTTIVDLILKENDFEKIIPDLSKISITRKTKKKKIIEKDNGSVITIKTYYNSLLRRKNILMVGEQTTVKIAVVLDNVSNISNPKEKEAIKSLIKLNNKFKRIPIIIIANVKHSKIVNEIRKMVIFVEKNINEEGKKENMKKINEIVMKSPNINELETLIKKVCITEKLKLLPTKSDEEDLYIEIIEHSQYDVRRLINILEELKNIYDDVEITLDKLNLYKITAKKKDIDPGIYEATRSLLNDYSGIDSAISLYSEERATIPLMVHENYPLNLRQQYPKMNAIDQINIIFDVSKSISESDKVDGLIYSNQCWSLQSVHGFYSCVLTSYHINKVSGKMRNKEIYKYTQDYNKTSIMKINNKAIRNAQEHQLLKTVSIYDFLYIASILRILFNNKRYDMLCELLKPYNLTLKKIESIIKIDKIKNKKSPLTGKQKTIMKEKLGISE